ncbi:MAG: nucleotide exchange factor GrpE [Bacteroidota bacterium]
MNEELKDQKVSPEQEAETTQQEENVGGEAQNQTEAQAEGKDAGTQTASEADADKTPEDLDTAMEIIANLQLAMREKDRKLSEEQDINMRLQADFVNFRKRKEKETRDTVRFANEDLLITLLPILDNFDRTLSAIEKTDNLTAIKEGITLVSNSMKKQLGKIGLEILETKGKPFDSAIHEAIATVPAPAEDQQGIIIDEIERGYKLKDKVIRFAKVVVGE